VVRRFSHVIGFDDGPFPRIHRGDVLVVGTVFSGLRLEGILSGKVRRDGANSTRTLIQLVSQSRFAPQVQLILLQGIAFAGFNVIDIQGLQTKLRIPVVAVSRRQPDLNAIRQALLNKVPGGKRKWALIERLGTMERAGSVYVQYAGITLTEVKELIQRLAVNSALPEPLRIAHLIAGGIIFGESKHRA
jgi:endonuclease V-like protein UPF0215 family